VLAISLLSHALLLTSKMSNAAFKESYSPVAFSATGQALCVFSSVISSISSGLVMNFILRSQSKLKRPYHCIMFSMSVWDIISSLAMASSTLLMPADVHMVYPFQGKAYGTVTSCEAQGFIILFGSAMTIGSNMLLNAYYVITILFKVREERFQKYFMLPASVALFVGNLVVVFQFYLNDQFNPTPYYPYCFMGAYPHDCNIDLDSEGGCIRGGISQSTENQLILIMLWFLLGGIVVLLLSMAGVIVAVFKAEREMISHGCLPKDGEKIGKNSELSSLRRSSDTKRTVLRQAVMYVGAFFLTWGWSLVSIVSGSPVAHLKFFFQPLQGFFNAFIFFYVMIGMLRKAESDLTFVEAVRKTIFSPSTVPEVVLSRIEMVDDDTGETGPLEHCNGDQCDEVIGWPQSKMRRVGIITRNTPDLEEADCRSVSIADDFTSPSMLQGDLESIATPSADLSNAASSKEISYTTGSGLSLESRPTSSKPKGSKYLPILTPCNRKFYNDPKEGWGATSNRVSFHSKVSSEGMESCSSYSQKSSVLATNSSNKDIFSIAEDEAKSHGISYDST